ncbi:TonB-dependent receptor domain-containing protein [Gallaecimonas mangrovi]|uniref:TonB-dependent receptor domain-containing protein n=1 Tax=Gallaecimonas mangrovi TaxID=2291597 RepID=UPI000E2039B5|nr:TonB-dependent receptor [Gallaecimonas mangrovi]
MRRQAPFKLSAIMAGFVLLFNQAAHASEEKSYPITLSAQTLDSALLKLAEESHVQIMFSPDGLKTIKTPSISANLSVSQALKRLLPANYEFIKNGADTYIVRLKTAATPAQKADPKTSKAAPKRVEHIEVTGSNIRANQDTGALPVTTLSASDVNGLGITSGDDLLAQLPQQGAVNFNSSRVVGGVNDARGDVSSINLRGIGTGYTLTLLNGRRMVQHPGTQAEDLVPVSTVNSNSLPVMDLKRLEVLRDGAAAVYGTDAVAGVVNYITNNDLEGGNIKLLYGTNPGVDRDTKNISANAGFYLDDAKKTHMTVSASLYHRDILMASEEPYSASSDLRDYPGLSDEYADSTLLDNRSTSTPWGVFESDSLGKFHLQPTSEGDCEVDLGNSICAADGNTPRDLRYDLNSDRSLSSEVSRFNFYSSLTHEINENLQAYGELMYYQAVTHRLREQSANLSTQRFTVSADAYYNPFGEDVYVYSYRPVDAGLRHITVDDYSYRVLGGLKGYIKDWDFDSAFTYSKAHTADKTKRIDTTLFEEAVNSTDPDTAYDIFNGGSLTSPNSGDDTVNSQSVINSFLINVQRTSETQLATYDFKLSRPDLFSLPAGDVGFATGAEVRYQTYSDKRSDALNGTDNFVDITTGETSELASSVWGSSPTPDSSANRTVLSAYGEFEVPILADKPLVKSMSMQLAARYEKYNDVGHVFKPKAALSWRVDDWWQLRSSYSEGFKAPGLAQTSAVNVTRSNTRSDPVYGVREGVVEFRNGSSDLKPETSKNRSAGIVFTPTNNLTLTLDWWNIKQKNIVGILSSQTQILYDALLRSEGSSNPNVVRDDSGEIEYVVNDYTNLLPRETEGLDYSADYRLDTGIGQFKFKVNAAKLTKFNQGLDSITQTVIDAQNAGNSALEYDGEQVYISGSSGSYLGWDGHPKWRGNASINWTLGAWGAGATYRYVSSFFDSGLYETDDDDNYSYYLVHDWSTVDAYLTYTLGKEAGWMDNTKITLGARNIGDKEPPFANTDFGYESSVHTSAGRYVYLSLNKKF